MWYDYSFSRVTCWVHGRKGRQTVLSPIYRFVCVVELEQVEDIQASDLDVWVRRRWLLLLFCCLKSKHQGFSVYQITTQVLFSLFLSMPVPRKWNYTWAEGTVATQAVSSCCCFVCFGKSSENSSFSSKTFWTPVAFSYLSWNVPSFTFKGHLDQKCIDHKIYIMIERFLSFFFFLNRNHLLTRQENVHQCVLISFKGGNNGKKFCQWSIFFSLVHDI